ncbi:hypothetical protein MAPG_01098 [Magnaporthiopsis poae ATCC 64411]|uniref:Uncharacterized protein n=1 Tax=Magnaporthiopsis poae (strain ATCC 64411 / 73-15) TaxID=644358 RepID=A0A0C4DMT6_MAGP6|nr:hypothetical protein MAPG_01098 [Magnaporthiopsis poae ATCC 64411]
MRYIVECREWRLLQALGALVGQRKSRFVPDSIKANSLSLPDGPSLAGGLLEFELRRIFLLNDVSRSLSDVEFEECDMILRTLCNLLDKLVDPRLARGSGSDYPCLRAVVGLLEDSDETYDLASSSNPSLFKPPDDEAELERALAVVTEQNDLLSRILSPSTREPAIRPARRDLKRRRKTWKDSELRDRATATLRALFDHLRCGGNHEVILKLSDSDAGTISPELNLMLSACPDRCGWLEVQSGSTELSWSASIAALQNICADLSLNMGRGKGLVVHIERYGLFGAWTTSQTGSPAPPKETLDQLISNGAFKPLSLGALASGSFSMRYKPQEKRALAVRLGYCLMDFFDSDLSSKRIYFLGTSSQSSRNGTLYLSFTSGSPAPEEPHIFRVGHPALLSFAKLLLEIDFGETIPLEISQHYDKTNQATWAELCDMVDQLEEERHDSYIQAIRGCLIVHSQISKALRLTCADRKAAELTIRKELYREIVCKLEDGLEESMPRSQRKRQRSESPEPTADRKSNARTITGERDSAFSGRPFVLQDPSPGLPARPPSIAWDRPSSACLVNPGPIPQNQRSTTPLPGSSGLFDDCTPDAYPADVCAYADNFISTHRGIYDELIQTTATIPRVKVAVLDTGLDVDHPSILANKERIRDVKSWLPASRVTNGDDICGHGTHVTGLLLDMAPDCDVYVAQIADNEPLSPHLIAKAIDHAVTAWQVDIVSMSFGFLDEKEQGCGELREAVLRAHASGVLMFAAASNVGAYGMAPAFPARLSNVFCIYSGDGMGNCSRTSPTARRHGFNFLTLGEGVESAWPRLLSQNPWTKRKSGTSFATPIAAGLAAALLLYAHQNLPPEDAKKFKEYDKMRDWLFHASNERNGYDALSLSNFFNRAPEERRLLLNSILEGRPWRT